MRNLGKSNPYCMPSAGSSSTDVYLRRSPSQILQADPLSSAPVAVLSCCTDPGHSSPRELRDPTLNMNATRRDLSGASASRPEILPRNRFYSSADVSVLTSLAYSGTPEMPNSG